MKRRRRGYCWRLVVLQHHQGPLLRRKECIGRHMPVFSFSRVVAGGAFGRDSLFALVISVQLFYVLCSVCWWRAKRGECVGDGEHFLPLCLNEQTNERRVDQVHVNHSFILFPRESGEVLLLWWMTMMVVLIYYKYSK